MGYRPRVFQVGLRIEGEGWGFFSRLLPHITGRRYSLHANGAISIISCRSNIIVSSPKRTRRRSSGFNPPLASPSNHTPPKMEPYHFILALFSAVVLYLVQLLLTNHLRMRKYKLPPRIKGGVPLFGHMFQVPPVQQGPWAKKLAEEYGEM